MKAYQEFILNDAMTTLANSIDYAINSLNMKVNDYSDFFLVSGLAKEFANGNPHYLLGISGIELTLHMIEEVSVPIDNIVDQSPHFDGRTKEYWSGEALTYLQWYTNLSFDDIFDQLPLYKVIEYYQPYHEASFEKFANDMMTLYFDKPSKLKIIRKRNHLSQRELSERSKINIRNIQMYEQHQNDIKKAQADTLLALAKTLHCKIEDLL